MINKLHVGNLAFETTEIDLQDHFSKAGAVTEVALVQDKVTGKSRGFAFVTMSNPADAQKARKSDRNAVASKPPSFFCFSIRTTVES